MRADPFHKSFFLLDGRCIGPSGYVYSPLEVEEIERIYLEYQNSYPPEQESHLLKYYPEGQKFIEDRLYDFKAEMAELPEVAWRIKQDIEKIKGFATQEFFRWIWLYLYFEIPKKELTEKIEKLERMLLWARGKNDRYAASLERARTVPIDAYVKFNSMGFAPCLWHNEKTASLKYYKKENHVHCFGCQKGGDVVDVVMALTNCSFKEALQKIGG